MSKLILKFDIPKEERDANFALLDNMKVSKKSAVAEFNKNLEQQTLF